MSKKRVNSCKELNSQLLSEYKRWKEIFDFGCSDPYWSDGMNINLVRNHILYQKRVIEETLGNNYIAYPNSYFYPEPIEMPKDFMAVSRKLITDEVLTANKNMCYNDAIKFDWSEVLNA